MRITVAIVGLSVAAALSAAASIAVGQSLGRYEYTRPLMGTTFRIVLYASEDTVARSASADAFARLEALERVMSDYDPASEVSRLSASAGQGRAVEVSDDLWTVLERAVHWAERTDGAFDPSVGSLTRAWRWGMRRGTAPSPDRIAKALETVGHNKLHLNRATQTVLLETDGMRLDLGGIGKGYAADAALATLRRFAIKSALIDAGGDLAMGDAPPDETGWRVEVTTVDDTGQLTADVLHLANLAVATSGDAYRFVEVDGVRFSHILDPRTGMGVTARRVVTIVAPYGADADALASAVSVLGSESGLRLLNTLPDITGRVLEWSPAHGRWTMSQTSHLLPNPNAESN